MYMENTIYYIIIPIIPFLAASRLQYFAIGVFDVKAFQNFA
jgi:hypothetical protein